MDIKTISPELANLEDLVLAVIGWGGGLWLLIELVFFFVGLSAQNDPQARFYQIIRIMSAILVVAIRSIYYFVLGK